MAALKDRKIRDSSGDADISRGDISKYQQLVNNQATKGAAFIDRAIKSYVKRHPDAGVAEIRKFTYELMQDALPNFTDLAETLSCEFMEEVASRHGWVNVRPEIIGATNYSLVNERLHYLAKNLAEGDVEKYRKGVLETTRFYIKRAALDSMVENCNKAKLRYARVPSGFETCGFCFMLASRGFVYKSELKAGLGHAYHPNCNCTIVPGAKGHTRIDGYDPQGMAERWDMCLKTLGGTSRLNKEWNGLSELEKSKWLEKHSGSETEAREAWITNCIIREAETRDWHWLYTGETPKVSFENDEVMRDVRKNRSHEEDSAKRIAKHGITPVLMQDYEKYYDEDGEEQRRGLADLIKGVELKTLGAEKHKAGASTYNTINEYIKRSSKKKENMRILIFDNSQNKDMEDDELVLHIQRSQSFRRGRIYVLDHEESYRFIR